MSTSINRRTFLLGTGAVGGISVLPGCGADNGATFSHGVASGDPLQDRVILWTRATPAGLEKGPLHLNWEVASDKLFSQLVAQGETSTNADRDFTVKVDAIGLKPGKQYYYRFIVGETMSSIGRTRTLPEGEAEALSLGVVSCSNYGYGKSAESPGHLGNRAD